MYKFYSLGVCLYNIMHSPHQMCLDETTTVVLEEPEAPLLAVGEAGVVESYLNITAGTEGGPVVWHVETVNRSYSEHVRGYS